MFYIRIFKGFIDKLSAVPLLIVGLKTIFLEINWEGSIAFVQFFLNLRRRLNLVLWVFFFCVVESLKHELLFDFLLHAGRTPLALRIFKWTSLLFFFRIFFVLDLKHLILSSIRRYIFCFGLIGRLLELLLRTVMLLVWRTFLWVLHFLILKPYIVRLHSLLRLKVNDWRLAGLFSGRLLILKGINSLTFWLLHVVRVWLVIIELRVQSN